MGIKEALTAIMGLDQPEITSVICTVDEDSVDLVALTCTLTPVGRQDKYYNARLSAAESVNQSLVVIPKSGSYVIAALINQNDVYVTMISESEKIMLHGETFGGLVKVEALVSRLNDIETTLDQLISNFKLHIHPGGTLPSGSTGAITPIPTIQDAGTSKLSDLQNENVKHG